MNKLGWLDSYREFDLKGYQGTVWIFHNDMKTAVMISDLKDFSDLAQSFAKFTGITADERRLKIIAPSTDLENIKSALSSIGLEAKISTYESSKDIRVAIDGKSGKAFVAKTLNSAPTAASDSLKNGSAEPLRVGIVEDSQLMRQILNKVLSQHSDIQVVYQVESPVKLLEDQDRIKLDVLILDLVMPGMTGVEVLRQQKAQGKLLPTIIVSSLDMAQGTLVLEALELGAFDYIRKPEQAELRTFSQTLVDRVRHAAKLKTSPASGLKKFPLGPNAISQDLDLNSLILIGASTGGTEAIKEVLTALPRKIPPIMIVQHIPPYFSAAFADRLRSLTPFDVREAKHGDTLSPGTVLIAPGGQQMRMHVSGNHIMALVDPDNSKRIHKPSINVLFNSAYPIIPEKTVGVILTGMGDDGAEGLLNLRESGAFTIAQSESTCVVYGMPKAAVARKAATKTVDLGDIAGEICRYLDRNASHQRDRVAA